MARNGKVIAGLGGSGDLAPLSARTQAMDRTQSYGGYAGIVALVVQDHIGVEKLVPLALEQVRYRHLRDKCGALGDGPVIL